MEVIKMCRNSSSIHMDQAGLGIIMLHASTHGKPEVVDSVMEDINDNGVRGKCFLAAAAGQGLGPSKEHVSKAKMAIIKVEAKIVRAEATLLKIMGPEKLQVKQQLQKLLEVKKEKDDLLIRA
jgi:hypothetical protein